MEDIMKREDIITFHESDYRITKKIGKWNQSITTTIEMGLIAYLLELEFVSKV